jgi:hypothetical protein
MSPSYESVTFLVQKVQITVVVAPSLLYEKKEHKLATFAQVQHNILI